jgi:hypothetical protein
MDFEVGARFYNLPEQCLIHPLSYRSTVGNSVSLGTIPLRGGLPNQLAIECIAHQMILLRLAMARGQDSAKPLA